ncbi:MAG: PAS domain-containing protein [Deltaproteobacteria bacterium]|nr:PAS domain-containing protein [Deltaproteobacteria bacterium]
MKDSDKAREQLIQELEELRSQVVELKSSEKQHRVQVEQLSLIMDALPVTISYVDSCQYYRFNNKAYRDWFGHSISTISNRHIKDVMGDKDYSEVIGHVQFALTGKATSHERLVRLTDGSLHWIHASYVPHLDDEGS